MRKALPEEARHLLLGAAEMETVWRRLDDRYGNKHQRSLAIYERLARVELKGKDYDIFSSFSFYEQYPYIIDP